MTYIHHTPSSPLAAYIDYFYYLDGAMPYPREKILPTGWLDLEINFGDAIQIYDASGTRPVATCAGIWWVGVWDTYGTVEWPSRLQLIGIHFKAGGAYPFLKFPLFDLHNQIISAEAIWGTAAAELRDRLSVAPTIQDRFTVLEAWLLTRLSEAPYGLKAVQYAVSEIVRHHGALPIEALSNYVGMSHNHLLTQFKRMVGISPKALARLYRLKYVLHTIDPMQDVDWSLIAAQANYYDQSHFSNDLKTFTGHSPLEYLRLRREAYTANPERNQLLHVLSIN